jgi:hypothetical protein
LSIVVVVVVFVAIVDVVGIIVDIGRRGYGRGGSSVDAGGVDDEGGEEVDVTAADDVEVRDTAAAAGARGKRDVVVGDRCMEDAAAATSSSSSSSRQRSCWLCRSISLAPLGESARQSTS